MEQLILALLCIVIILLIVILFIVFKNKSSNNMSEVTRAIEMFKYDFIRTIKDDFLLNSTKTSSSINELQVQMIKEISEFKDGFSRKLSSDFTMLNDKIENRLNMINDKVNSRLDENFAKTNQTFTDIVSRLTKIDEAQKKIDSLSTDIVSLQSILTDKKSRGIFGEVNLKHILANVFGEKNDNIYRLQYKFDNGYIADAILFAPEPLGMIAIDSKFPLENYRMMVDKKISEIERMDYEKLFKIDIKKHIDAIANKYIIDNVTSDQAIMFLPAEAIYAEINAYHPELIEYAHKRHVWITSNTTLISTLTVLQIIIKDIERSKYTSIIHEQLNKLSKDFDLYRRRWDSLAKNIDKVSNDVREINITSNKIANKFDSINKVEIEQLTSDSILINSRVDKEEIDDEYSR